MIEYTKSRLVNILKKEFSWTDTGNILKRGDLFMEAFEKTNRVKARQIPFLKSEISEILKKAREESKEEEEPFFVMSPTDSVPASRGSLPDNGTLFLF